MYFVAAQTSTSKPQEWGHGAKPREPGETRTKDFFKVQDSILKANFDVRPKFLQELQDQPGYGQKLFDLLIKRLKECEEDNDVLWHYLTPNPPCLEKSVEESCSPLPEFCTPQPLEDQEDQGPINEGAALTVHEEVSAEVILNTKIMREQYLSELRSSKPAGPFMFEGTIGQNLKEVWRYRRQLFVPASIAKQVVKLTDRGKQAFLAKHMWGIAKVMDISIYQPVKWGLDNEPIARTHYQEWLQQKGNYQVEETGL